MAASRARAPWLGGLPAEGQPHAQGLAFPGISSLQANGPFFNMIEQGLLDANQFTVSLNGNTSAASAGVIIFGGNDSSLYTGPLRSYPVLSPSCAPCCPGSWPGWAV